MIPVILRKVATAELNEAYGWYEGEQAGLGERFLEEFESLSRRIAENPFQFPIVYRDVHRTLFRRFPYSLFFRIRNNEAVVIACFHAHRDPTIWEKRL
ncbi:MAG: type II toxin-antitoxin system RelE/ParE family toxin [Candidatus Omnitrophica bacterium]|nr:type II toxin-antitoxin system RelE/ParE family toxin [Candidatus Omnitrophota bacterium]